MQSNKRNGRRGSRAGRHSAAYYWPSRLKFRLAERRAETGGDGSNWKPIDGALSFVEQFFVMGWALRSIEPSKYRSEQRFIAEVFDIVSDGRRKVFGPAKTRGARRTPGPNRAPYHQHEVAALMRAARGEECVYDKADLSKAIRAGATIVDRVLAQHGPRRSSTRSILSTRSATATHALCTLLKAAGLVSRYVGEKIVRLENSEAFDNAAELPGTHALAKVADAALTELKRVDGARVVVLQGSPFSGRTIACRYILDKIKREDDGELVLTDRSALPVIAVSLDDLEPSRCVDDVLGFFSSVVRAAQISTASVPALDDAGKLAQLARIAPKFPVFFLLAGFRRIGSNPIVSAVAPNLIAGLFDIVLRSHPETRILVTADTDGDLEGSAIYRGATAVPLRIIPMADALYTDDPVPVAYRDDAVIRTIQSWRRKEQRAALSGLTLAMAYTFGERLRRVTEGDGGARQWDGTARQLYVSWQHATHSNKPFGLLELLWRSRLMIKDMRHGLLDDREKMLLGMISASHDGLQLSTMLRLLRAMRDHQNLKWDPGSKPRELIDPVLDAEALLAALDRLRDVVECRTSPKLDDHGLPIAGKTEPHFWLFNWRRRSILALWFDTKPRDARNVMWLIAREAAQRAMVLARGSTSDRLASAGRDLHALSALLGSIDFEAREALATTDHAAQSESEPATILPHLLVDARKPNGRVAFAFAWRKVYAPRLGRGQVYFPSLFADSEVRFSSLMSFLHIGQPWLDFMEERLDDRLSTYAHQVSLLGPLEAVELLTQLSAAAHKLCRFDVVLAAKRLAEQLCDQLDASRLPRHKLVEVLCTEIDASIMSGRCLDAPLPLSPHVAAWPARSRHDLRLIRDHIDEVIETYVPVPDAGGGHDSAVDRRARAVLLSRKGEVSSLMGEIPRACRAYAEADKIEEGFTEHDSQLLGRSTRRHARALLRSARKNAWRKAESVQCTARYRRARSGPRLRVPHPGIVSDKTVFAAVGKLIGRNERFAKAAQSAGNAAEIVGVNILRAYLESLRHENVRALRILERATEHTLSPGIAIELYLDLWGVRAQVMIDSALSLLVEGNVIPGFDPRRSALAFGEALGATAPLDRFEAAGLLLLKAKETIAAMRDFSNRGFGPLRIFADYQGACARALGSQLLTDASAAQSEIAASALNFVSVIGEMSRSGYRLFEREAVTWRDLLVSALEPQRTSFSD